MTYGALANDYALYTGTANGLCAHVIVICLAENVAIYINHLIFQGAPKPHEKQTKIDSVTLIPVLIRFFD